MSQALFFPYLVSNTLKLCRPWSIMQVLIVKKTKTRKIKKKGFMQKRGLPFFDYHHPPREKCQCLYCYLICKNGKIVQAQRRKKRLINTGKKLWEKFVLGEILTVPRRKISIKWSCRTTSIIHTHSH